MEKPIRELTITRTFDAPRELVWKAWTDQELVRKWWGPQGVTNPTCVWEARTDGKIDIVMLAGKELGPAAGMRWPMNGAFREVTPQSRLVFTSNAIDDNQEALLENVVTVDLQDMGGKTKMTIHIAVTKAVPGKTENMLGGMAAGWNQQTDKLVAMVNGMEK
ncbi:MAG: SRPBCC domain-containing protein [Candidatus Micrarchaeota archaeon]|nr:SRPBCC domain-containing protein [Candidatus Micrarchaeota archaeon]